jgi:hypothetical protein
MNRWRQILRKIALPIVLAMGSIVLVTQLSVAQYQQRFPLPNNWDWVETTSWRGNDFSEGLAISVEPLLDTFVSSFHEGLAFAYEKHSQYTGSLEPPKSAMYLDRRGRVAIKRLHL